MSELENCKVNINVVPYEHWHAIAYDEYKNTFFALRSKQLDIIKTYLWLCSALLSFELVFVNELFNKSIKMISSEPDSLFVFLEICAVVAACIAFSLSIVALRVRNGGELFPFSFCGTGVETVKFFASIQVEDYFTQNIDSLHKAILSERAIIEGDAKKLRLICLLLLGSFFCQIGAVLWLIARSVAR